ncbi:glycosyltransferase family 2 protein [Galbitalea sp. SE-J8]|uniref:glycosyltransferase family 2 protein n=1 Tax=Galbitalea sp. SE-J8 TaxID=3054952 RepID=UPI00259C6E23|nr:glycosyltransferase family 2 protein [Galbitalea sp. SE-J8]MDM4762968.1 glycosyltransferase family 2 protein [Galbitalea sp. SE-J8]
MASASQRQVPAYRVDEIRPRASDLCVVVFVINEGERVRSQLRRMRDAGLGLDVIVADGGSTDGSLDRDFLGEADVRALLTKTGPGKLSAQMRMAFDYALDQGYSGVIVIDGNGKDGIEAIPDFARLLHEGYDHIQGSRYIPGGRGINTPFLRHWGLLLLHAPLISIASRTRQTDTTNGFRGYSARLLGDPEVDVFRDVFQTYELHYHLAIEAGRSDRFRTTETPVTRAYPKKGKTPTKISPIKGNAAVLSILFAAARGAYRSPKAARR